MCLWYVKYFGVRWWIFDKRKKCQKWMHSEFRQNWNGEENNELRFDWSLNSSLTSLTLNKYSIGVCVMEEALLRIIVYCGAINFYNFFCCICIWLSLIHFLFWWWLWWWWCIIIFLIWLNMNYEWRMANVYDANWNIGMKQWMRVILDFDV